MAGNSQHQLLISALVAIGATVMSNGVHGALVDVKLGTVVKNTFVPASDPKHLILSSPSETFAVGIYISGIPGTRAETKSGAIWNSDGYGAWYPANGEVGAGGLASFQTSLRSFNESVSGAPSPNNFVVQPIPAGIGAGNLMYASGRILFLSAAPTMIRQTGFCEDLISTLDPSDTDLDVCDIGVVPSIDTTRVYGLGVGETLVAFINYMVAPGLYRGSADINVAPAVGTTIGRTAIGAWSAGEPDNGNISSGYPLISEIYFGRSALIEIVPEPGSLALLSIAASASLLRRRRRT